MSVVAVRFTPIFGLKNLPVHHVSLEFNDLTTRDKILIEHPPMKRSDDKEELHRLIIGSSKLHVSEIKRRHQRDLSRGTVRKYVPGFYDCRHYVLDMASLFDVNWNAKTRYATERAIRRGLPIM